MDKPSSPPLTEELQAAFPRTAKYDPRWVRDNALGEHALCQAEFLAGRIPFSPGMRVLELGCGKATSSIFLAREFGVQVWAMDNAISPTENRRRALDLDCEASVFPMRGDARDLPFAEAFFDVAIAIDSFLYFGTDEHYLAYLAQFIKPGGFIGVVDIALTREIDSAEQAPAFMQPQIDYWLFVHTVEWWKRHWEKTGLIELRSAEIVPESDELLRLYAEEKPPEQGKDPIRRAVPHDQDGLIALFAMVGQKR